MHVQRTSRIANKAHKSLHIPVFRQARMKPESESERREYMIINSILHFKMGTIAIPKQNSECQ